ncbi:MAG: hypothetical protein VX684_03250, partial [Planctomycetota bacterium]|nr:hypothetical protein [Planctomycetota bacterium]
NIAHNLGQMLHRRPQNRLQGLDGTWMVGGGTHPGSGLPVIFLASQTTARMLCQESGLTCVLDEDRLPPLRSSAEVAVGDRARAYAR